MKEEKVQPLEVKEIHPAEVTGRILNSTSKDLYRLAVVIAAFEKFMYQMQGGRLH